PARRFGRKKAAFIDDEDEDDEDDFDDDDEDDFEDDDEDDFEDEDFDDEDDFDDDFDDEDDDDDFADDFDDEDDDDDDDDEPGFFSNVFGFLKGIALLVMILAVIVLGMRVLEEKDVVSCQWFRDHLGSVGTAIFGETPNPTMGSVVIEGNEIM
ncbi:MAG: hypothetical protein IJD86_12070, partial [Clostridia bacterium]|nr:hypothetical protein [Clostridia bacterium]